MLLLATFLFNLFCGLIPCDPKTPIATPPEILDTPQTLIDVLRNDEKLAVDPFVRLPSGALEGFHMKALNGREFFAFEGVPYGETTGGANRWKCGVAPVSKTSMDWRQTCKKARGRLSPNEHGSNDACIWERRLSSLSRLLDFRASLFVNVYTPNLPDTTTDKRRFPVIVFIHGGFFMLGAGADYGPTYLLSEDVILVTMNYRLGVLGFLSTGDHVVPGNNGLKDQALALKWVHENIPYFGGNPQNISLWGNSAGGVSAHLHLISPTSRHYFSTALSSSGPTFMNIGVQSRQTMRHFANKLGRQFGCQTGNSWALFNCLKYVNVNMIVSAQFGLYEWFPFPLLLFTPTVEPPHATAFLTMMPEEAYKRRLVANKPLIMGLTKDEGATMMMLMQLTSKSLPLRVMWDQIAPIYLEYKYQRRRDPKQVTKLVEEFYLGGKPPKREQLGILSDMLTDRYMALSVVKGIQSHCWSGAPTYSYYFSYSEGKHSVAELVGMTSKEFGAGHTEDIFYLFNNTMYFGQKHSDPDHTLSTIFINTLVNFISTGKPMFRSGNGKLHTVWEPATNISRIVTLQLDKDIKMIPIPAKQVKRLNFWNDLHLPNISLLSALV